MNDYLDTAIALKEQQIKKAELKRQKAKTRWKYIEASAAVGLLRSQLDQLKRRKEKGERAA